MQKKADQPKVELETLEHRKLIAWRRKCFTELLGEDCLYIDALILNEHISREDVKELLDKGCPAELVPRILL